MHSSFASGSPSRLCVSIEVMCEDLDLVELVELGEDVKNLYFSCLVPFVARDMIFDLKEFTQEWNATL